MQRRRPLTLAVALVALVLSVAAPALAAQSSTWGWTTDTFTMSFYGGIPYVGCEKARLTVPNAGSTGTVTATTWSSIVVGPGANCATDTPSSLNAYTISTRTQVTLNGVIQASCTTATTFNAGGQGVISVSDSCPKSSSADATWRTAGTYGWYDYDDTTWRSETVHAPTVTD